MSADSYEFSLNPEMVLVFWKVTINIVACRSLRKVMINIVLLLLSSPVIRVHPAHKVSLLYQTHVMLKKVPLHYQIDIKKHDQSGRIIHAFRSYCFIPCPVSLYVHCFIIYIFIPLNNRFLKKLKFVGFRLNRFPHM